MECNKCMAEMSQREGKYGPFWGCSAYPDCDNIVKIPKVDQVQVTETTTASTPIPTMQHTPKECSIIAQCLTKIRYRNATAGQFANQEIIATYKWFYSELSK